MSEHFSQVQRRRRGEQRNDVDIDRQEESSRQSPSSSLDPAPRHPLRSPKSGSEHIGNDRRVPPQSYLRNGHRSSATLRNGAHHRQDEGKKSVSTMDKLEEWFGLGNSAASHAGMTSNSHSSDPQSTHFQQRETQNKKYLAFHRHDSSHEAAYSDGPHNKSSQHKGQRLVLVHPVSSGDSLEALALRYKTDVRSLRKANGLWPGDSVQTRSEIYIPVDDDEEMAAAAAPIAGAYGAIPHAGQGRARSAWAASEGTSGQLTLLNSQNLSAIPQDPGHSRAKSAASVVSSAASGRAMPSPTLRVVPLNALSYFPSPQSLQRLRDSTSFDGHRESVKSTFGLAEGYHLDRAADPGESGIEDLLQLAERAKMRGTRDEPESSSTSSAGMYRTVSDDGQQAQLAPSDSISAVSSSPKADARASDEPWKPNKWTLGGKKGASVTSHDDASLSNVPNNSTTSKEDRSGPIMMASGATSAGDSSRGYQGWNDIPEPPLSATAKGKVAHAYKPKRRYPRPGNAGVEIPGATFIDDLVAGLPPNSGPAANWARPIADSVPIPEKHARTAPQSNRATPSGPNTALSTASSTSGWGQILSDTVRGKMRLEDALERGFEDLRQGLASVTSNDAQLPDIGSKQRAGPPRSYPDRGAGRTPTGSDPNHVTATSTLPPPPSSAPRRPSSKSLHELVDLRHNPGSSSEDDFEDATAGHDAEQTATPGGNDSPASNAATSGSGMRGRRNMRNVDWLS